MLGNVPTLPPQAQRTYLHLSKLVSCVLSPEMIDRVKEIVRVFSYLVVDVSVRSCIASYVGPALRLAPFHLQMTAVTYYTHA